MKPGHLRVPHGWWYPELRGKVDLSGAFMSSDAVLCSDDDEFLDHEQESLTLRGILASRQGGKPAELESVFDVTGAR